MHDHLVNIGYGLSLPWTTLTYLQFVWAINRQRKTKQPVWPVAFHLNTTSRAPNQANWTLEKRGVTTHTAGALYVIRNNVKMRVFTISVSSAQAGWADMLLDCDGWTIEDKPRSTRNLKALPRPWGVTAKARTFDMWARRMLGRLLGAID